jgi:hypothetical protein
VKQHPEYLKNQSRYGHARYRRHRALLNIGTPIWLAIFMMLLAISAVDRAASLGWGYASHMWEFLAAIALGISSWIFNTAINNVLLAYTRHTYGPDPVD